jgi:tellurite resistance protein TehA-like permease
VNYTTRLLGGAFGYIGALVSVIGYILYGTHLLGGEATTNLVTWGLWSLETVLGFLVYKQQTQGDLPKYVEEMVAAVGCCAVTLLLVGKSALTGEDLIAPIGWIDGVSVLLFAVVFVIYRRSLLLGDVWPATLAFQGVIVFSALPLARSAFENPSGEPLTPWVLWAMGFGLQFLCVLMRQEGRHSRRALLTPLNYLFWHGLVAGIVYFNAA